MAAGIRSAVRDDPPRMAEHFDAGLVERLVRWHTTPASVPLPPPAQLQPPVVGFYYCKRFVCIGITLLLLLLLRFDFTFAMIAMATPSTQGLPIIRSLDASVLCFRPFNSGFAFCTQCWPGQLGWFPHRGPEEGHRLPSGMQTGVTSWNISS